MRSSLLGTVLLTFAVAFAFAGVMYSNLSWIVAIVGLLCVYIYSHMRFADELRSTDLEVQRTVLDDMIMTDEPVGLKVSVLNRGDRAIRGVFEEIIPDDCEVSAGQIRTRAVLPPRSRLAMTYSITPRKRGTHQIAGIRIQRHDAFGLYVEDRVIPESSTFASHASRETFQTAQKMARRERLEFSGAARNPAIVLRELEFEGIREYTPGDRARDIHWKTFPKLGKLMTKVYRKEGVLQAMVFVDSGRSMRLQSYSLSKIDHAIDLAIQLSHVLLSSQHPAGAAAFDEVKVLTKVGPALGRSQPDKIANVLRSAPGAFRAKELEQKGTRTAASSAVPAVRAPGNGSPVEGGTFLETVEGLSKRRNRKGLGLGLDGAINEAVATSRGKEQLFIVITDLMSSREAVIAGARICKRTGNKMLVIHTYDDWYRKPGDLTQSDEVERLYGDVSESLKVEALLRALGTSYVRVGPADNASGVVRATRRGKA